MTDNDEASWQEGYNVGHIDGESSCAADWCLALSEVLPNGFDLTPSTVAAEIARLRRALRYISEEATYREECQMVAHTALRGEDKSPQQSPQGDEELGR